MRELAAMSWILMSVVFASAIPGGAFVLGFGVAGFVRIFAPIAVLAALGGTTYWLCHARHGPNWDRELMGLIALFAILADILIVGYAFSVAISGLRP